MELYNLTGKDTTGASYSNFYLSVEKCWFLSIFVGQNQYGKNTEFKSYISNFFAADVSKNSTR